MITVAKVQHFIHDQHFKEQKLETDARAFLEKCGWTYTCNVPGSLWLYQKTLPDGRTALVTKEIALRIEVSIAPAD